MIRDRLVPTALATAFLVSLPLAAAAQDFEPGSPEGTEWTLTSYYDEEAAELVAVPFEVTPTLLLQDGVASGSGGCNQFSGSYELDGGSLRFGQEMSVTLALCEDPAQSIEDAYLAALGDIEGWLIDGDVLELSDDFGDLILTFEVPHILWTSSQVQALMATIGGLQAEALDLRQELETLREDTDSLNVPRLRERIRTLESENAELQERLTELEQAPIVEPPSAPGQTTSFSAAERVLLKGIPTRIANKCRPLRSSLPKATKAAVACTPSTSAVAAVNYYLLEGPAAASAFGSVMGNFNVPDVIDPGQTCAQGVKSQQASFGGGWQAEGCYRTNRRAELRFVDNATDCKKLRVAGKTMADPALFIELQGTSLDVAQVYEWATRDLPEGATQLTTITRPIPSDRGPSTSCAT